MAITVSELKALYPWLPQHEMDVLIHTLSAKGTLQVGFPIGPQILKKPRPRWSGTLRTPEQLKEDLEYEKARAEHIWLLKAEGLTYRKIAPRIGVTPGRIQQIVKNFGRKLSLRMKFIRTKITVYL